MHTIVVVAFEGISPFHLSVPCMVFGDNLARLGVPRYDLLICGEKTGLVRTLSGFNIDVPHDLTILEQADTVIVPAWHDPDKRPSEMLLQALRQAHARGARIVGLCLGAFVLAEAGLLDGLTASTHWVWADDFARKYPQVTLDNKVLYVVDGNIVTSAGTAKQRSGWPAVVLDLTCRRFSVGGTLNHRYAAIRFLETMIGVVPGELARAYGWTTAAARTQLDGLVADGLAVHTDGSYRLS